MSDDHSCRDRDSTLPCATLDRALVHLRRPPSPAAVRFKIQNTTAAAAQVAAYIDARLVFDRLDTVAGGRWHASFEALPESLRPCPVNRDGERRCPPPIGVRCRLTVLGVTREDVGAGDDPKAAFSDAIKRAAVQFGIGRALYAMKLPWLRAGDGDRELRRNRKGQLVLDDRSQTECRRAYQAWLERAGIRQFGHPLDHGDEPPPSPAAPQARDGDDQAAATSERREAAPAALHPVKDPDQDGQPASDDGRGLLRHRQHEGGHSDATLAALAELAFGSPLADLDGPQTIELAWQLELAAIADLSPGEFADSANAALKHQDRTEARGAFVAMLVQRANARRLLDNRAA